DNRTLLIRPNTDPVEGLHVLPPSRVSSRMLIVGHSRRSRAVSGSAQSGSPSEVCESRRGGLLQAAMIPLFLSAKSIQAYTVCSGLDLGSAAAPTSFHSLPPSVVS